VAGVLYRGEEGAVQASEVELPFSVTFAEPTVTPDCTLTGDAIALGVVVTKGGLLEMDLLCAVKCYRPYVVRYATDIQVTPIDCDDAVMSVYFAPEGATVWDIARAVHASPAELLRQNPALEDAESSGIRRVTIFRHRDLN
jgi:hypothetical protein